MRTDEQIQKEVFGQRLKWLCQKRGLRAVDIARRLGVSPGAVSNWFGIGEISLKNAVEAADLVGTSVNALWRGGDEFVEMEDRSMRHAVEAQAPEPPAEPREMTADALEVGRAYDKLPSITEKFKVWSLITNLAVRNPFFRPPTEPAAVVPAAPVKRAPAPAPKPRRHPTARK